MNEGFNTPKTVSEIPAIYSNNSAITAFLNQLIQQEWQSNYSSNNIPTDLETITSEVDTNGEYDEQDPYSD